MYSGNIINISELLGREVKLSENVEMYKIC